MADKTPEAQTTKIINFTPSPNTVLARANKRFFEVTKGRELRTKQIEHELREWASKSVTSQGDTYFLFDKILVYPKRCVELVNAVNELLLASNVIPAMVVSRALLETNAMGCFFIHEIRRLIASRDNSRLYKKTMQFLIGGVGGEFRPIHVMDAIRHLEELDKRWFKELTQRMDERSLVKKFGTRSLESVYENVSVTSTYRMLSEVAHPNGFGTYVLFHKSAHADRDLQVHLKLMGWAARVPIWQCRHLLQQLKECANIDKQFRTVFPKHQTVQQDTR